MVQTGNTGGITWETNAGVIHNSNVTNLSRLEIERNGPVHCTVVAEGWFSGIELGYRVIYDFYANKDFVNTTVTYRNSSPTNPSYKMTDGAQVIIDTTLTGDGSGSAADESSGVYSINGIPSNTSLRVTSFYSSVHSNEYARTAGLIDYSNGGGYDDNMPGYAVELVEDSSGEKIPLVPRTSDSDVPTFQWLQIIDGSKNMRIANRYGPWFFPNGYTFNPSNGYFSFDFFSPYAPVSPQKPHVAPIGYMHYESREVQFHFNATASNQETDVRKYTNAIIFVPSDTAHYGNAGVFLSSGFYNV
ncbi:MAG: hypothetical protein AABY11_01525, partial [archaeon]